MRASWFLLISSILCSIHAFYAPGSSVATISGLDDLKTKVFNGPGVSVVEYFAESCGHCKSFAPEYEKVATALKGVVPVYAVSDEATIRSQGVESFPTIKVYLAGKGVTYKGRRDASALTNFVLETIEARVQSKLPGHEKIKSKPSREESKKTTKGSKALQLTTLDFDSRLMADEENNWFVMFFAPWCGHCKNLAPVWDELAVNLKGSVLVAKVDATAETGLAQRFQVQGFPTLLFFPGGKKSTAKAVPYNGDRSLESLREFAMSRAKKSIKSTQLLSNKQFHDACDDALCVIGFLPNILDSSATERKKYIKSLDDAAKENLSVSVKYFWIEGGENRPVETKLNLEFGWPAVIMTNLKKDSFVTHRGSLTSKSISEFVKSATSGRHAIEPIPSPLPAIANGKPWDGKDLVVPSEEL